MKKAVLITGAAKRLGKETSLKFAENGWHVIIHYNRSRKDADTLCAAINASGGSASVIQLDVSELDKIDAWMTDLIENHPGLCALINNASVFEYDNSTQIDLPTWNEAITANTVAPIMLAQAYLNKTAVTAPVVVNILDQKLANLNPDYFSYTLSKAALKTSTDMLAMAYKERNARICNVAPGLSLPSGDQTDAEFAVSSKMNLLERTTQTAEIAEAIYFVVTSGFASGETLFVDSGQHLTPHERDVMFLVRGE